MKLVPDAGLLPIAETPPAGHATTAAHFLREHLPRDARAQHKDDSRERSPIVHGWTATVGFRLFGRQERLDDRPQRISQKRFSHASIVHQFKVLLGALSNIEHEVDSLDQTNAFALRPNYELLRVEIKKIFRGIRRAQVYLAANGKRGVNEIAELLSIRRPNNVSRELGALQEEGLLEVFEKEGGKTYWNKKPVDRTLRISQFLREEFHLDSDGLPVSQKK